MFRSLYSNISGPCTESSEMWFSCCAPAVSFSPNRSSSSNPTACFDPPHPLLCEGKPPLSSSCQHKQQCVEVSQTHLNWSCHWSYTRSPDKESHRGRSARNRELFWGHGRIFHVYPGLSRCSFACGAAVFAGGVFSYWRWR